MRILWIAAGAINREDGKTLFVRKRGTVTFMQPGGKIEQDEEPILALCRELSEELGLLMDPSEPENLGRYSAPAANEPEHIAVADIFRVDIKTHVTRPLKSRNSSGLTRKIRQASPSRH